MAGITATYVDADTFTVATDMTLAFVVGRRVKCDCGVDGDKYGTVESSSYAALTTTVNLVSTNDDLTSNLVAVWFGIVSPGTLGSVPQHPHTGYEGSGGSVSSSFFYADPDETDQGAAGDGNTIKAFVDAVSTNTATICLRHNSGSATTTYTLTTSETIPSNITLEREDGAIIDGVGTLTINGPFKSGLSQAFGSSITIAFGDGFIKEVYPQWWGAVGDGATSNTAAIQSALDSGAVTVCISDGEFLTGALTVPSTVKRIYGDGTITASGTITAYDNIIDVSSNTDMIIDVAEIDVDATTYATNPAITLNSCTNIKIKNILFPGGGLRAVNMDGCTDCTFSHSTVTAYAERACLITNGANCVVDGIVTKAAGAADAIKAIGGTKHTVKNCVINEAAAPYFGIHFINVDTGWVLNNDLRNTAYEAIALGGTSRYIKVQGNHCEWEAGEGGDFGMSLSGTDGSNVVADCLVSKNTIYGSSKDGICVTNFSHRNVVDNNIIINCCRDDHAGSDSGIHVAGSVATPGVEDTVVSNNIISNTVGTHIAIGVKESVTVGSPDGTIVKGNICIDVATDVVLVGANSRSFGNSEEIVGGFTTLANDATPTVAGRFRFLTGGTTTITDFDDGYTGQIIRIISEHAVTITDGTNILLNGSGNFVMAATDTLTLICKADNKWYELARSDNT